MLLNGTGNETRGALVFDSHALRPTDAFEPETIPQREISSKISKRISKAPEFGSL